MNEFMLCKNLLDKIQRFDFRKKIRSELVVIHLNSQAGQATRLIWPRVERHLLFLKSVAVCLLGQSKIKN